MSHQKISPDKAAKRTCSRGLLLLGGSALLFGIATGGALAQPKAPDTPAKPAEKAAPKAMTQDPTALASLASFLRDYDHALAAGNRQFLTAHTVFPLPFAQGSYDMEAKAKEGKLASVAELLKARQTLRWPQALVPKNADDLTHLQRGVQKCDDKKSPDVPDFTQGGPAIELHGDEATLTYLNEPCESETHVVTLTFVRSGQTWRLRERAVRMGTS
jgi:hypothetical protein